MGKKDMALEQTHAAIVVTCGKESEVGVQEGSNQERFTCLWKIWLRTWRLEPRFKSHCLRLLPWFVMSFCLAYICKMGTMLHLPHRNVMRIH